MASQLLQEGNSMHGFDIVLSLSQLYLLTIN